MRILTFTSLFPNAADPGHGIFIYQRSAHLAKIPGTEVVVVSPIPYFPRWLKSSRWRAAAEIPSQDTIGTLRVEYPRYFLLPKVSMTWHAFSIFLGTVRCVSQLHRLKKIDCIDAHFVYPDGMAAVILGKWLRIPVTVSARGTDINSFPDYATIRPMIRWTLRHAAQVIAVSESLKRRMVRLGIGEEKIRVIPNGIDDERFHPATVDEAKVRLNLPPTSDLVVSVGALIASKGHALVIRAFATALARHPQLQLYILGKGEEKAALEKLIAELRLADSVFLMGKRPNEELRFWYSAARVSCLASSREGWPNVVTESLACGTPVVATRVGGIPDILHSKDLGILVERNVESIAHGLEEGLAKNWDRLDISKQTLSRTWDVVASEVEEVLTSAPANIQE